MAEEAHRKKKALRGTLSHYTQRARIFEESAMLAILKAELHREQADIAVRGAEAAARELAKLLDSFPD